MDTTTKAWPPHKYAFETMEESGEMMYGNVIKWQRISELFGIKDTESWPFRSEWFELRKLFEERGFIATEAKQQQDGFRFLNREEMADHVRNKENRKANDSLRKSLTLSMVPREKLPDVEVKKLDHWEAKAALVGATAKVLLRKRSLPSPEQAIKSLKEIC